MIDIQVLLPSGLDGDIHCTECSLVVTVNVNRMRGYTVPCCRMSSSCMSYAVVRFRYFLTGFMLLMLIHAAVSYRQFETLQCFGAVGWITLKSN